mgnify:CR=1 FL=1
MMMITRELQSRLLANGADPDRDHAPVVKFFAPWGGATWLLSEMDPANQDFVFGLCDLGLGYPELGWASLSEIYAVRGPFELSVERDIHFTPDAAMAAYARDARAAGYIAA